MACRRTARQYGDSRRSLRTVRPKAVTHPTDARLMHKAIEKLGIKAKAEGLCLRQSYARLAKRAAQMASRYIHAKQFKRANRELKFLRTRLGRLMRDIRRSALARHCATCPPIAPTSIPSNKRSPHSKQCFARLPLEPSTLSSKPSPTL